MKIKVVIEKVVTEFGTKGEQKSCGKIVEIFAGIVGEREVSDRVVNKVLKAGRQLKALGIR